MAQPGGEAVLAAGLLGGSGTEQDFLLGPGRIECFEIVGLGIGFSEKPAQDLGIGLNATERQKCGEDGRIR